MNWKEFTMKYGGGLTKYQKKGEVSYSSVIDPKTKKINLEAFNRLQSLLKEQELIAQSRPEGAKAIPEIQIIGEKPGLGSRIRNAIKPYVAPEGGFLDQWRERIVDATGGADWYKQPNSVLNAFSSIVTSPLAAPQYGAVYGATGKVQTPSEAMNIQNPYGAFAVDALLDPVNLVTGSSALKLPQRFSRVGRQAGRYAPETIPNFSSMLFNNVPFENVPSRISGFGPKAINPPYTYYRSTSPESFANISNPINTSGIGTAMPENLSFFTPDAGTAKGTFSEYSPNRMLIGANLLFKNPYKVRQGKVWTNEEIKKLIDEGYDSIQVNYDASGDPTKAYEIIPLDKNIIQNAKPINVSEQPFRSEIDWSKWNRNTPKYPKLISEYNQIEEATKKAGTWMKNPDGTPFEGTPEQFIQFQSSHFKKAFPQGFENVFRGVNKKNAFADFSKGRKMSGDRGIFTSNPELAWDYANFHAGTPVNLNPFVNDNVQGLYNLIYPKGKTLVHDANQATWKDVNIFDNITSNDDIEIQKLKDYFRNANLEKITTNDIARYIPESNLNSIVLKNINDGGLGDITIVNNRPGNYLKSLVGNVGFFDMTNPNIYKGLLPYALPIGAAAGAGALQQNQKPQGTYQYGGGLTKYQMKGEVSTEEKPKVIPEIQISAAESDRRKAEREYDKRRLGFIQSKMQDYIRSQGQFGKNLGLSMQNFPEDVMMNYANEFDYKENTKSAEQLAKNKGWDLKDRTSYVDKLTPRERNIIANSQYGANLQPSIWARTIGGVQELGNTLLPGQPFQFDVPGLSPKEEKEYRESALSAFNTFAPLELSGTAIANYAKNRGLSTGSDYAELSNPLSGKRMGNVSELDATLLSPSTWQGLASLPSLAKSVPSIYKTGKSLATGVYNAPMFKVGRDLAAIEKEGKALGLSDFEIARRQMEQVGITSNQRQAYTPVVSELIKNYVKPRGYSGEGGKSKFQETIKNIIRGGYDEVFPEREDAWRLYLGMPQKSNTFSLANTAPINHPAYPSGSLKGMDIYNINSERVLDEIPPAINANYTPDANWHLKVLDNPVSIYNDPYIMGGYNRILTKEGTQYNDIWDLAPYVPFKGFFPKKMQHDPRFEKLFYKTSDDGVQTVRGFQLPVEKFVGKPFMSHGNLPYTSTDYVNKARASITNKIEQFEPYVKTVFKGDERLAKMRQDLKDLENYPKYQTGGPTIDLKLPQFEEDKPRPFFDIMGAGTGPQYDMFGYGYVPLGKNLGISADLMGFKEGDWRGGRYGISGNINIPINRGERRTRPDMKDPVMYQYGGASRADTLNLLANTMAVRNYYTGRDYAPDVNYTGRNLVTPSTSMYKNIWNALNEDRSTFIATNAAYGIVTPSGQRKLSMSDYYRPIDRNRFYQREDANLILDTRAPMQLYDKRIEPTGVLGYTNIKPSDPMSSDIIHFYTYDPISITPWDMLSTKQKKQRINKYGVSGTPYESKQDFIEKTSDQEVIRKQKLLKEAGLYKGAIDGDWGSGSEKAWKKYTELNTIPTTTNTTNTTSETQIVPSTPRFNIQGIIADQYVPDAKDQTSREYRYRINTDKGFDVIKTKKDFEEWKQRNAAEYQPYYQRSTSAPIEYNKGRIQEYLETPTLMYNTEDETRKSGGETNLFNWNNLDQWFKNGGESEFVNNIYSDYMDGVYDGTPLEQNAKKVYDKLNTVYYNQAKESGMTPPNYIMTNVIKKALKPL